MSFFLMTLTSLFLLAAAALRAATCLRAGVVRAGVGVVGTAPEGAGGAARVVADGSQAPGCPQPWRMSAVSGHAVVGRGPACQSAKQARSGAAGDATAYDADVYSVPLSSLLPLPSLSPSSPRRRGSIGRARALWRVGQDRATSGDRSTKMPMARPTGRSRTWAPRVVAGWIPACAVMMEVSEEVSGGARQG